MRAHKGPRTGGGPGVGPLKGNEVEGLVEVEDPPDRAILQYKRS